MRAKARSVILSYAVPAVSPTAGRCLGVTYRPFGRPYGQASWTVHKFNLQPVVYIGAESPHRFFVSGSYFLLGGNKK